VFGGLAFTFREEGPSDSTETSKEGCYDKQQVLSNILQGRNVCVIGVRVGPTRLSYVDLLKARSSIVISQWYRFGLVPLT